MIGRLALRSVLRSPRRFGLGLLGVALPVALFASTAFYIDTSAKQLSSHAVSAVQIDMQVLASTPATTAAALDAALTGLPHVRKVEPFATVDLTAILPGGGAPRTIRVFSVLPGYLANHPWVKATSGTLAGGAMLADTLGATVPPGAGRGAIRLQIPGAGTVGIPIVGTVDLRKADTWFALTAGDNQGNVVFYPDSIVVDYAIFSSAILPALRASTLQPTAPAVGIGGGAVSPSASGTSLGTVSVQAHVGIDRSVLASDPSVALARTTAIRRSLERALPGQVIALDNLGDSLSAAKGDAANAKVLFLFLGIPGVLVAGGLALATSAALASARRREVGLLRLRGASGQQVTHLAISTASITGVVGSILGLALAVAGVTVLLGSGIWNGVSASSLVVSIGFGLVVGLIVTAVTIRSSAREAKQLDVIAQRKQLQAWNPAWKRLRLDFWAIAIGLAVLGVNALSGGFRATPSESQTLSLSFYLLIAPVALWAGLTLLGVRVGIALLAARTGGDRDRQLGTWTGTAFRWLGRRPGRSAATVIIGALAVAFGTNLVTFVHTYNTAKANEAALSIGSDIRVTTAVANPPPVPPLHSPDIAASVGVRVVNLGVGADKRTAFVVDPVRYAATVPVGPIMVGSSRSAAIRSLSNDPLGVLVSDVFVRDFNVATGDSVNVTVTDVTGKPHQLVLHASGVFHTLAPTVPGADLLMNEAAIRGVALGSPDFYLARATSGSGVTAVAARLSAQGQSGGSWTVQTYASALAKEQSTLATLNLGGLSRIEIAGAAIIAALGIGLLGAFLVLERRREYAVLRSVGASTRQVLVPPAVEGAVTVTASLLLGVPIGIGMALLSTRVLTPLFTLPPPLLAIDGQGLFGLLGLVLLASAVSIVVSLIAVARLPTVQVLREG